MDNQKIVNAALIGGLVSAVLFTVPFLNLINCFCCIGIMLGGTVALLYHDRSFEFREYISPATAITIGLSSGIAGAFISLFIDLIIFSMFGNWELEFLQQFSESMEEIPEMSEMFDEMLYELEQEENQGMNFGRILIELVRNLILLPIFSMVGALITRLFLNKNRQVEE
jgi:hypothetical protein